MVVHHDLCLGVVVHGVDGEVAPHRVFFLRAPHIVAQHTACAVHRMLHTCQLALAGFLITRHLLGGGVVQISTKGGDLYHLMLAPAPIHHMHDAKASANDEGSAKQAFHLLGRGVGGHIKVFGA